MNSKKMIEFIEKSPSVFHAVKNVCINLKENGFVQLSEKDRWNLKPGKYFVTRNSSSVISFVIPKENFSGFLISSSHSDSPCFKVKENPEIASDICVKLNVEKYGGMLMAPWFDRPLSVAGRIIWSDDDSTNLTETLVDIDRDLVLIPSLAIHMNRDANKGSEISIQNEMCPLFSLDKNEKLMNIISKEANVSEDKIISADLYLYNRCSSSVWGAQKEFISAPKLDDLECVYTTLMGFLKTSNENFTTVHAVFDNEEVGSLTRQGADSTFLNDVLHRINSSLGRTDEEYHTAIAQSFMVSADNAHAVHPNYSSKADPINRPELNKGPVIKFNAAQKYTSDAVSSAMFKQVCKKAGVPFQIFTNNSDVAGGSTLGNISNAHVSLRCVDIGIAQLAMHSPYETAGIKDIDYMIRAIEGFYSI